MQFHQNLKIPRKYAGTTSGVVCAIGYCPDLFIFVLYGYWLDKFGNAANNKKNTVLDYEMEYLLGGKASDKDNLEYVIGIGNQSFDLQ